MSTRLQIIVDDEEAELLRACARAEGVNLSEWIRRAMAMARKAQGPRTPEEKLAALRRLSHMPEEERAPAPPIEDMLREVNARYDGLPAR
ncbi:MAG: plasmid mobilization protein [Gaiellales bacterium]